MTLEEELRFRRMCPYDAFGDYSDVLKEIRQKEKEKKTDTVSVTNRNKYGVTLMPWFSIEKAAGWNFGSANKKN